MKVSVNDFGTERLPYEPGLLGHDTRFRARSAGRNYDRDVRPRGGDRSGQSKTVELSRHMNIREDQHDILMTAFHQLVGCITVFGFKHLEAGIL